MSASRPVRLYLRGGAVVTVRLEGVDPEDVDTLKTRVYLNARTMPDGCAMLVRWSHVDAIELLPVPYKPPTKGGSA